MNSFEYIKASSISEALELLSKHAPDAKLLAGGSDLLIQIRQHAIDPPYLIDLKGISNLKSIECKDGTLDIGAFVTLRDIEKSETIGSNFPALTEGVHQIAGIQIRNRATLGGNLCQNIKCPYYNQSHINLFMRQAITPCFKKGGKICHVTTWGNDVSNIIVGTSYCKAPSASDMATVLAALGGRVELVAKSGSREVNVDNLHKKNGELNIAPNEILTHVKIPSSNGSGTAFLAYKANPGGYTLVSVAISLLLEDDRKTCQDIKVYLGGVAPQPYQAKNVEEYARGKRLSEEVIEKASQLLFENIGASSDTTMFKVTKARALCREAFVKSLKRGQERLT